MRLVSHVNSISAGSYFTPPSLEASDWAPFLSGGSRDWRSRAAETRPDSPRPQQEANGGFDRVGPGRFGAAQLVRNSSNGSGDFGAFEREVRLLALRASDFFVRSTFGIARVAAKFHYKIGLR